SRNTPQEARKCQQPVEPPGSVAKESGPLLEVDVDAAKENALLADVRLVGAYGRVGGEEQGIMAQVLHRRGQRVVAHTRAAIHPGGPGCNRSDSHHLSIPVPSSSESASISASASLPPGR